MSGWYEVEMRKRKGTTHWVKRSPAERPLQWAGNGSSREAKLYRAFRDQLLKQVGKPTPVQDILIHRLAWVQVHLARMDARSMHAGELSDWATRQYLAWTNTVSRMLQALGVESPSAKLLKAPAVSLADHIATRRPSIPASDENAD